MPFAIKVLLIDDQPIIAEAVRRMLQDQPAIAFHYCQDPSKAIAMANEIKPTVILQDLVMPEIDGLLLVRYLRANPDTKDVPLIVLSTKEEPKIKAESFALGANDYLVKLPDKIELLARIHYHSSAYIRLLERNEAYEKLKESQRILNAELMEAAAYVKSLLPPMITPSENKILQTDWRFIPSTQLGGDAFGYHWLDPTHFALYLLDVCGHGVGAAVLSISIMNVLRAQTLPNTDFYNPSAVLETLNESFPMEQNNNMFFTMWYGVYHTTDRTITYASGGHPPAILMTGPTPSQIQVKELRTPGLVIGGMSGVPFASAKETVEAYGKLFVFSDGVYEIEKPDGTTFTLQEFIEILKQKSASKESVEGILEFSQKLNGPGAFADDFSLIETTFF